ncbi:hypothetical protein [Erwinia sp. PsM31]|jgi:hypothetical protein|uniref:hypothetical protein n=1 Tax=Erwinia sp. PsM31 TaxID=3030535 RepID=UPI00263AED57|nr:hypothetical protein [Erwinia sp. PsM31]MDN4626180.1 hypothetical protein [Erwinia sp. PsM31]
MGIISNNPLIDVIMYQASLSKQALTTALPDACPAWQNPTGYAGFDPKEDYLLTPLRAFFRQQKEPRR